MCKLDVVSRRMVEAIRECRSVHIVINEGAEDKEHYVVNPDRGDFKHFRHELRLIVQEHVNSVVL